jgi:lysozyme family protein
MLGYSQMWDQARLDPITMGQARARMALSLNNKGDYEAIHAKIGVPILFIAPVHEREGSQRFTTHLHNGDPLTGRTYHVPIGRPKTGEPPFKWADSAIDALTMKNLDKIGNWSVERLLYEQHKYNGITKYASSYVFSGTQYYISGMWVRDHVYDSNVTDHRPGTLVMMKALIAMQPELANLSREPTPPKEVIDEHKAKSTSVSRVVRNASGGAAGAGGGTEIATKPGIKIQGVSVLQVGIGLCAAIFLVAAIWVVIKKANASSDIHELWSGS